MRFQRFILALLLTLVPACVAWAAEDHGHAASASHKAERTSGLPPAAPVLFKVPLPVTDSVLPVTNSMVLTWVVALAIILGAQLAMRRSAMVPAGAQNFWEWMVDGLEGFLAGVIGKHLVEKTFWFFGSLFIFIVITNWSGLFPLVGTVGWGYTQEGHGFHVSEPLLRGAHADFNMTFAMSMVFFALWLIWAIQENGVVGFLKHLFAPKGATSGPLLALMVVVFFAVGLLEVVSIVFRPVSLSFRLFGNIYAGENMLESMTHLGGPMLGWLTALPFYFMELMVGLVQGLVFMLLTAVFTLLICTHDESHGSHGDEGGHSGH